MKKDEATLEVMNIYGGSFAAAIAMAAHRADSENYLRLKTAFPELWERYSDLARELETRRNQSGNAALSVLFWIIAAGMVGLFILTTVACFCQ